MDGATRSATCGETRGATGDSLLDGVQESLAEAGRVLRETAEALEPLEAASPASPGAATGLIERLRQLDGLLAAKNMRALEVHAALARHAAGVGDERLATLDNAIARLDFTAAREATADLIARWRT